MIKGLEFLKSWRFWVVLVASALTLNIGSGAAYITSDRYLIGSEGVFDPLNVVVAGLAGLPLFFLCMLIALRVYKSAGSSHIMPKRRKIRYVFALGAVSVIVLLPQIYLVNRLILAPFSVSDHGYPFILVHGFTFILCMLAASFERAEIVAESGV